MYKKQSIAILTQPYMSNVQFMQTLIFKCLHTYQVLLHSISANILRNFSRTQTLDALKVLQQAASATYACK